MTETTGLDIFGTHEAAEYLGVSLSTFKSWLYRKPTPAIAADDTIGPESKPILLFKKATLDAFNESWPKRDKGYRPPKNMEWYQQHQVDLASIEDDYPDDLVRKRAAAIRLIYENEIRSKIAKNLRCSAGSVSNWHRRFIEEGISGITGGITS